MKEFLKNHKKVIVVNVCAIVLIALIAVIAMFATTSFAESSSIGKENAQNFAFVDAGIDPFEAEKIKTEFEFKNGQFIYDVEFVTNGTEYEYWIKASNGSIIKKEMDASDEIMRQKEDNEVNKEQTTNNEEKNNVENNNNSSTSKTETKKNESTQKVESTKSESTKKEETTKNENTQKESTKTTDSSNLISLETAKSKALSNAGVSASKCTFTKAKLDTDDGIKVYDIEFKTSDKKYEYEINAKTGEIHSKDIDTIKKKSTTNNTTSSNTNKDNSSSYIGIDKAKSIALRHSGVSNVTFEKAKLDRDDGKTIYEIEFYKDNMEYSYEIDALTGKILDYEKEYDDGK